MAEPAQPPPSTFGKPIDNGTTESPEVEEPASSKYQLNSFEDPWRDHRVFLCFFFMFGPSDCVLVLFFCYGGVHDDKSQDFRQYCIDANVALVRPKFLEELCRAGGVWPRRQEAEKMEGAARVVPLWVELTESSGEGKVDI